MIATTPPSLPAYRTLGRTGLEVSSIGYGMWGMTGWKGSDDTVSRNALRLAAESGCTFYDSAAAYGDGRSDILLGELLAERLAPPLTNKPPLVAASKVAPANGKWPASPKDRFADAFPDAHVQASIDTIRRSLQLDTIPILQLHVWDDSWATDRAFPSMVERLLNNGSIAHFGLSLNRWQPANGLAAIRTGLVETVQVIYNIFDQDPEDELFPLCLEKNIGVIARVPLDEGSLGGRMTRDTTFDPADWRSRYFSEPNFTNTLDRIESLRADVPATMTMPEMALRFALSHPAVHTVIAGMRSPANVIANFDAMRKGPLDADLLATLRKHRWERKPAGWSD